MVTIQGIGRLSQEPKMDYTPNGTARTVLNMALTSGFGDKKKTTWARAVCFGTAAEILNERVSKGQRLSFTAEFQEVQTYEKRDGGTGVSVELKILAFEFIEKSQGGNQEPEEF